MTANLLSPVHIQKLGHPIEEIRSRALQSVWSKYSLDLVDYSNLENAKMLLEKLMDWFNFKTYPHEDKVLKLIIKILQQPNVLSVICKIDYKKFVAKIEEIIKHCVESNQVPLIQEIRECMKKIDENLKATASDMHNSFADFKKDFVCESESPHQGIIKSVPNNFISTVNIPGSKCLVEDTFDKTSNLHKTVCATELSEDEILQTSNNSCPVRIEYFTWQPLTFSDSSVLTTVYEGLRYFDNTDCILQSCQFYTDVLLKDFPAEVFLQRTLLIQTFFELLRSKDPTVRLPVLASLIATMKHLHNRFLSVLDIAVIHSKEFHKGFTFHEFEKDGFNVCTNMQFHSSESDVEMEKEVNDIKSHQFSLTQICFSMLSEVIVLLAEKKSAEEYSLIFELILETIYLLSININPTVWRGKHQFKNDLNKVLGLFNDPLKYHKNNDRLTYNIIVHIIVKTLILLKIPKEEINVLPHCIQMELVESVSDYIFILMFPNLNRKVLVFVKQFFGQRKKDVLDNYEVLTEMCNSMKSAAEFLKRCNKLKTKLEKLNHARIALPSLEFHRNFQFVQEFVKICLFKWSEKHLNGNEMELRKNILLKLLSHNDEEVKINVYEELHDYIIKHLGVEMAEKSKFQYPGNKFGFLCDSEILTEMICHGLNSSQCKIQTLSSEIFIHLLKGKIFFSDDHWQKLMKELVPCLPLLQCFADKSTPLGRCVLKMLDPDISRTISLPPLDLLKGNLRLLFSKNHLVREEALLRLFWLLAKEDPEKRKLPRLNLLRGINLSSVCSSVSPEEYSQLKQSFYSVDSMCNVMEMLTADGIEPSVRRSALSQLSVMLGDSHLQPAFLEQNGLTTILNIFKNCLIEREFQNYPDSVLPAMNILRSICLDNPSVRLQLSLDIDVFYCILRGLLLFNGERHSRQQGVELLCLLLYNEYIINMQYERAITCKISLPEVLINKICLPFTTYTHWKCSKHAEHSYRESLMLEEKSANLLRIYWNAEWMGNIGKLLALKSEDIKKNVSPFLPNDMMLKTEDLKLLRDSSLTYGMKNTLFDIQNATTHQAVTASLNKLNSYLLLYRLGSNQEEEECPEDFNEITHSLSKLTWETTFERFLISIPSCEDDEDLLFQVLRTIRLLLKTIKSKNLIVWVEKLLTDEAGTLPNIFKCYGKPHPGPRGKDLMGAVTGLIRDTIANSSENLSDSWLFYVNLIARHLKLSCKNEFYNVAHTERLLGFLKDMTGKSGKNILNSAKFYNEAIIGVMEIMITLHCAKDAQNSFLGTNIIKNCLYVLNHMLTDTQLNIKDWEHLWYDALSRVAGHEEQPNYCWLLSLWFARDPIVRALAIQLLVGFSLTCTSCELLIEELYIEFEYVRNECFKLLLDDGECNIVKEKAALLLSNLTCHGSATAASGEYLRLQLRKDQHVKINETLIPSPEFLQNLVEINFYDKLCDFLDKLQLEPVVNEEIRSCILENCYDNRQVDSTTPVSSASSASLIGAVSLLLLNIIFLNPEEVVEVILKSNLLESLIKIFNEAPEACRKYANEEHVSDLIKMYSICCKVITKCMVAKVTAYSDVLQSQKFVSSLYCLVNYSLFDISSETVVEQRNQLWCEILDILSILLTGPEEAMAEAEDFQTEGFKAVNYAMTENGTDYFISSLYLAMSSYSCDLRIRCLRFLTNLFGIEATGWSYLSVADIFNRDIFLESVEQAKTSCWKGFSICKRMDLNFTKRLCDLLLQALSLNSHIDKSEFKTSVPETLGSLLAICKSAKKFCMDRGLVDDILEKLRAAFIKLSLENIDCLRKASERKRMEPMLMDIVTYYRLLGNLLTGDEEAKTYIASVGLTSLIHKLWHWCTTSSILHITTLKLLTTFTFKSEPASRSLVSDKTWNMTGIGKSSGSATLLTTIMMHVEKEMELTYKGQNNEVLRISFQLLENCCASTECRSQIAKGPLISCFKIFFSGFQNKRRPHSDYITEVWYNFFIIFTSYQEGQLVLTKNQEVLHNIIVAASSSNGARRKKALKILRNICFHQLNRVQLLNHYQFLSVMLDTLKSGQSEEINLILHAIWGLMSNSQKAKITFRNLGCEDLLKEVKKKLILSSDPIGLSIADTLLLILQNK